MTPTAAPVKYEVEFPGPYLKREQSKTHTFSARVDIVAWRERYPPPNYPPRYDTFDFDTLVVVFPLLEETAHARSVRSSWEGKLRIDGALADETVTVLTGYPLGTRLARLEAAQGRCNDVTLELSYDVQVWRHVFDEAGALRVAWPKLDWPDGVKDALEPQFWIDHATDPATGADTPYDMAAVKEALGRWLEGARLKNPRDVTPAALAKILLGKVAGEVQPSGDGLSYNTAGLVEGIELQGPPVTLGQRRGSEHDMAVLLTALYRAAGIPARVVIGVTRGGNGFAAGRRNRTRLRSWVEFALYEEPTTAGGKATLNWIPVDVAGLRRSSSRPPPIERPWKHFGVLEDADETVPFAVHFHPPTTVASYGSPGFWGWMMSPTLPQTARQSLQFQMAVAPVRGGEPPRDGRR
ncbi:MAG: transglutaminase domain-containing protein [Phycisphaerae bacterium]|nr:transglutaminase domain-containing protein [Phycisphaerae bacterium]